MSREKHLKYTVQENFPPIPGSQYYEYREIIYPYENIKRFPLPGRKGMERFLPLLPIDRIEVTLPGQVSETPISHATRLGEVIGLTNLWIKHEEANPTGSFKDRESAVVVSAAVERGINEIYILSSGNAALSTAAYAQRAGIHCICYMPEGNSREKQDLIRLYGADLITRPGIYEDMYKGVVDENPPGWNVTTGQNEFRMEGTKTIAYELFEQFGRVPEVIVVPTGAGSCLAGIWKGFVELQKLGKIAKLPQMVAVQTKGGAPIAEALRRGQDFAVLGSFDDSIAEGIAAEESFCSPKAVKALQDSNGYVIEVSDSEIREAMRQVIRLESFIPEPTTAAVYAALPKLQANQDSLVVVINTGSGLRMASEVTSALRGN